MTGLHDIAAGSPTLFVVYVCSLVNPVIPPFGHLVSLMSGGLSGVFIARGGVIAHGRIAAETCRAIRREFVASANLPVAGDCSMDPLAGSRLRFPSLSPNRTSQRALKQIAVTKTNRAVFLVLEAQHGRGIVSAFTQMMRPVRFADSSVHAVREDF